MDPLQLTEIAELCGGHLIGRGTRIVSRISKDTRAIQRGDLYLALRGGNFDGNEFVPTAIEKGAAAAIIDRDIEVPADFPVIRVADGQTALQRLAAAWRDQLTLRVVGITGSSGKTSTKEFTAAVLGARFTVTKTHGNLNNHLGLPLTILSATSSDQAAVWEMGMNHPGEIAPLAALARPDAAIVTNIGVSHIEFFGSRNGIAAEKGELIRAVHPDGAVIIPADDDYADFLAERGRGRRIIRCGLCEGADVRAESIELTANAAEFTVHAFGESARAELPATGEHMVRNALLAIAAGLDFGLSLEECLAGLADAKLTGGRLEQKLIRGVRFFDDTYNANPDSVEAALKTLAAVPATGHRIAVLGRMGELGSYALTGYERVGRAAAAAVQTLVAVGPETAPLSAAARRAGLRNLYEAIDTSEAARVLRDITHEGDLVLVKGSRSAHMEQVLGEF
jgi:UDP-N-acetylmuramoyl-tripeptide--D-alanyl-D-alanine ligase